MTRNSFPWEGAKKVKVDVRVIAATHRLLREEVQQGRFREDLFYRLNVLHLHTPPLRERDGDIRLLLDHFLRDFSAKLGREVTDFSLEAIDFLNQYSYPGNVRELRNIAEYSANICQGTAVEINDLPLYLFRTEELPNTSVPPNSSVAESAIVPPAVSHSVRPAIGGWAEMEKE